VNLGSVLVSFGVLMVKLAIRSILQAACIPALTVCTAGQAFAADAAAGGVPITFTRDLALWSLIVFVLFLVVLKKFAWVPMIEGLDKREAGIRKAISDAEDGRRKSQALLADYEQKLKNAEQTVQQMVAEARRDAERTSQDLIVEAQKEMQAIRTRAKDDIRQAKDSALAEVFASVNTQVIRATEHVLGRALNESDQERLVNEALAGIDR
jgi:F-type H+-transporting ATPase subunit b